MVLHLLSGHRLSARRVPGYEMLIALILVIAVVALPFLAAPWLIIDDATDTADAIIVLGGEAYPPNRTIHALKLYNQRRAPVVVFAGGALPGRSPETSSAQVARRYALARGLPPNIALLADGAQSTYDEAVLVRELVVAHGWRSLMIVTDPYHTRRAVRTFRALIPEAHIAASAAPLLAPCTDRWRCGARIWRYAASELVKMGFYRLYYGVPLP
jgi:uncharacterized SAM-binding protein YcdF (DUF218 family)